MEKKKNNLPIYLCFGTVVLVIVLLFSGNLAYYRHEGLDGVNLALADMGNFVFHIGTDEYYLRYYMSGTVAYIVIAAIFLVNEQKYHHDAGGIEAGSADWNKNLSRYNKKYVDPVGERKTDGDYNMILSEHVKQSLDDLKKKINNNVLIVGGAGTGKSRYVIKPNILCENCSYVICDPSGEILGSLGKDMEANGYEIKVFNLVNMGFSNCYNPFQYIRDEAGVGILVDCFISNTTPPETNVSDPFWEKSETALYMACIFYLKDFADKKDRHFAMILKMIQWAQIDENSRVQTDTKLDKLFKGEAVISDGNYKELKNQIELSDMKKEIEGSLAWKNYQTFRLAGVRTLKSILISAAVRLNPFSIPMIENLTSRDTLDLDTVGDKKTAIFLIIPQANTTYNFLVSMMYCQMFDALYFKAEHQESTGGGLRLKYHVRFMMDEFANCGKVPQFPQKISTMRKYNISCTIVLQSLAQIKAMYKDDYETIIGNCSSTILLGTQELTTAEYYSKQLGKATIRARSSGLNRGKRSGSTLNFQQTGRELMTIDEIRAMSNQECLVFVQGEKPFKDKKYDLLKHPRYAFTGDADRSNWLDVTRDDRFLNYQSSEYTEMALKTEEAPEAEQTLSKPKDVQDVHFGEDDDSKDAYAKLCRISDVDREALTLYLASAKKRIDAALSQEAKRKAKILCVYDAQTDVRMLPAFVCKAYRQFLKPTIIFCNSVGSSSIQGCFVDGSGRISQILSYFAVNDISFDDKENFDEVPVYSVKNVSLDKFQAIQDSMRAGEADDTATIDRIEDIYKELGF